MTTTDPGPAAIPTVGPGVPVPDLVPAADVTAWAQRHDLGDVTEDARRAAGVLRAYLGWHLAPVIRSTVRVRHAGSRVLLLPTLRLLDVESVVEGPGGDPLPYDYEEHGVVHLPRPPRGRTVTVTYTHGHDEAPDGIAAVVLNVVGRAQNARGLVQAQETRGPMSRSESYGASANAVGSFGLLDSEAAQVARHRVAP